MFHHTAVHRILFHLYFNLFLIQLLATRMTIMNISRYSHSYNFLDLRYLRYLDLRTSVIQGQDMIMRKCQWNIFNTMCTFVKVRTRQLCCFLCASFKKNCMESPTITLQWLRFLWMHLNIMLLFFKHNTAYFFRTNSKQVKNVYNKHREKNTVL